MSLADQVTLLARRVRDEFNTLRATDHVKAATTAAITFTGTKTIDGVACGVGDRVLVKDQATASQNGVYVVASGTWARALDYAIPSQVAGAVIRVDQGTTNGGTQWATGFRSTDTLGTTSLLWTRLATSDDLDSLSSSITPAPLTTRRTGVATNSSTTFASCLSVNGLVAGKPYSITARGHYASSATTSGMGMNISGTITATAIRAEITIKGFTATSHREHSIVSLDQNTTAATSVVAAATDYHFTVFGEVRVATGGTLVIQFRSSSTGTITVQPDCTLIVQELP